MINFASRRHNQTAYSFPAQSFATTAELRAQHADDLERIETVLMHPRSLARPMATWRPPTVKLPPQPHGPELTVALSRHRVGSKVRARLRGFGEHRTPAYLVCARFTSTDGSLVSPSLASAWVQAFLSGEFNYSVHQLVEESAPTYCWLVDQHFKPLESPASLFEARSRAA